MTSMEFAGYLLDDNSNIEKFDFVGGINASNCVDARWFGRYLGHLSVSGAKAFNVLKVCRQIYTFAFPKKKKKSRIHLFSSLALALPKY